MEIVWHGLSCFRMVERGAGKRCDRSIRVQIRIKCVKPTRGHYNRQS